MSMEYNCLQTIMNEKNITYRELARMTGVSIGTLHKIANFQQSPTQKVMIAIARGLRMKVTDIFNLDY
jgi:transcriptional regulator with XRE-family HTH domain